jgi:hypothetical protein
MAPHKKGAALNDFGLDMSCVLSGSDAPQTV